MQKKRPTTPHKSKSTDVKDRQFELSPLIRKRNYSKVESTKILLRLGVCAMRKKIEAKPMLEILNRLKCPQFEIVIIDDEYWDKSYKNWPRVDALICFYSDGFPYIKAWKYVQMTKPFLINDLDKQQILWDRTLVYSQLKKFNIPTARHFFVCRNQETIQDFYKKRYSDLEVDDDIPHKNHIHQILQKVTQATDCISERNSDSSCHFSIRKQSKDDRRNRNSSSQRPDSRQKSYNLPFFEEPRTQKVLNLEPTNTYSKRLSMANNIRNPITYLQSYFDKVNYQNYQIKEMEDDSIMIGPHKLKKPFVQKPFDAQNHQVCIYYPESDGGGSKMLYRKKVNSCSQFNPNRNSIRTSGNYIYEEFLRTNGFDIKVYTVGPYYMHAEARKAPSLDGVVQRNELGKQKRYPVVLTPEEKFIAQKVVQVFQQYVCGFDLLRTNGKSYVCDVNGWSFVKGNNKYYDDCAAILKQTIFQKFFPTRIDHLNVPLIGNFRNITHNRFVPTTEEMMEQNPEELRSIVAIFRHGDRSPKQKMKLTTSDPGFLAFFKGQVKQLKLKDPKSLTTLLNITNQILGTMKYEINETFLKLVQMKSVLQTGGHFDGLNRKVQMKPVQFAPNPKDPNKRIVTAAVLILKWGGGLTNSGKKDAIELGKYFRSTYSNEEGLISLHSSYRHDLKTYSSDEGRCLQTAAAFLKGFLDLEGDLIPIINSMISRDKKAQFLLDMTQEIKNKEMRNQQHLINQQISQILNNDQSVQSTFCKRYDLNDCSNKYIDTMRKLGNPREKLKQLYGLVKELTSSIAEQVNLKSSHYYLNQQDVGSQPQNSTDSESQVLIYKRWYKLQKDFYSKSGNYNISKIPDIYDSIKYDMLHNRQLLQNLYPNFEALYESSQTLAYFVVPSQYGMSPKSKLQNAKMVVTPLCKKIYKDLMFWKGDKGNQQQEYWKYKEGLNKKQWRHVRTRLYFTSSSHIYSIFYVLALGNNGQLLNSCEADVGERIRNINYIGYLSHIQLRLYENLRVSEDDKHRFRLELNFSPRYQLHNPSLNTKLMIGHSGFTIQQIETFFKTVLGSQWDKEDL